LAKIGLKLFIVSCLILGCSYSTEPSFLKEDVQDAIQDICKNEYKIDAAVKRVGQTLWIYLPLENIFIKQDKPEKYTEKFSIENNDAAFKDILLELRYQIKAIPEEEKTQEVKIDEKAIDKINNTWRVTRRVLFSMERKKEKEPIFICLVGADIKNGFKLQWLSYYTDLKKISYGLISVGEYQHRSIQDMAIAPQVIGDKEGRYINYTDVTLKEFLAKQIQHRIKLKFQKPEVEKNADIDKEILKIITYTLKTYDFKDFSAAELYNLLTKNKIILDQKTLWAKPSE